MALPLPNGQQIYVERKLFPANYEMPSLEVATDHYAIGYILQGDRTTITPNYIFTHHKGSVSTLSPFIYHRTVPASHDPYERILIKFSLEFIAPLLEHFGEHIPTQIYAQPSSQFDSAHLPYIERQFHQILSEYEQQGSFCEYKLQCMLQTLLLSILEYRIDTAEHHTHETELTVPIMDAIYYMEKHYAEQITIDKIASVSGYSPSYFSRIFQSQVGKSYSEYLLSIRLKNVQRLLLNTDQTITEIALATGFHYPGNLSAIFKQKIGMTPLEYRMTAEHK